MLVTSSDMMEKESAGAAQDISRWFGSLGWTAFPFQEEAWRAYLLSKNGLIHAPSGVGKTYAAIGGPAQEAMTEARQADGVQVVWVTPLRALANDTASAIHRLLIGVGLEWDVQIRHGDIPSSKRQKQRQRLPEVLVTTPESLTLLLSYDDAGEKFRNLRCVVCDEWHELLGTKRGVQTELALARLQSINPDMVRWGLSATLGNLSEALGVLVGESAGDSILIEGKKDKRIEIETLLPDEIERFPWSGHLGTRLLDRVIERILAARTSLVFTNTRAQSELWYQALIKAAPSLESRIAVHHGSLSKQLRLGVEDQLNAGELLAVICTSSLDLGVDFSPVEQVIQIGSPKGIARLTQRAGRSGHKPGATSKVFGVPTNALEILEFAAAQEAMNRGEIESRRPIRAPLDVLLQHVITMSISGLLTEDELLRQVRSTAAYRELQSKDWEWVLGFAKGRIGALKAYPEYQKVTECGGKLVVAQKRIGQMHRMGIGTITSDVEVAVKLQGGGVLGHIEERFITRLKSGDQFSFAGSRLELVRFRGVVAEVKRAQRATGHTPSWQGGSAPLSSELAFAVSREITQRESGPAPSCSIELQRQCPIFCV